MAALALSCARQSFDGVTDTDGQDDAVPADDSAADGQVVDTDDAVDASMSDGMDSDGVPVDEAADDMPADDDAAPDDTAPDGDEPLVDGNEGTLEDEDDEDDGEPPPPPCPDADVDNVCDKDDNCVAVKNPTQHDGDQNGVGDVCDEPCKLVAVPGELDDGRVKITGVSLNGSGNAIEIAPGGEVQVQLAYDLKPCSVTQVPVKHQIMLGFDDGSAPLCAFDNICTAASGTATDTLRAPLVPGTYSLLVSVSQELLCRQSWSGGSMPELKQRIAMLCVK